MTLPNRPRYATRLNAFKRKGDTVEDLIARAGPGGRIERRRLELSRPF